VPGDVSVVSMVTSPQVADLATPALTAMNSPGSALGRIAIETLLRHVDGGSDEVHQQLLPCTLEIRGSSGSPRTRSVAARGDGAGGDPPAPDTEVARRRAATRRRA